MASTSDSWILKIELDSESLTYRTLLTNLFHLTWMIIVVVKISI